MTSALALLQPANASEKRQLDTHEHGLTILNIALEDSDLFLEIEAPAMNIVGFEYAPSTDEQKQAVNEALELLEISERMFQLTDDANCTLVAADAQHLVEDEHEDHNGHKDHDDHNDHDEHHDDHKDHNDHKDHDEHHDDHKDHEGHGSESSHAEFRAQYQYNCGNPGNLADIWVGLFEYFPLTEEVEASFVGPQNQTFKKLTRKKTILQVQP